MYILCVLETTAPDISGVNKIRLKLTENSVPTEKNKEIIIIIVHDYIHVYDITCVHVYDYMYIDIHVYHYMYIHEDIHIHVH